MIGCHFVFSFCEIAKLRFFKKKIKISKTASKQKNQKQGIRSDISDMKSDISGMKSNIRDIQSDVHSLQDTVQGKETGIGNEKKRSGGMISNMRVMDSKINDIQTDVHSLQDTVQGKETGIGNEKKRSGGMQLKLQKVEASIKGELLPPVAMTDKEGKELKDRFKKQRKQNGIKHILRSTDYNVKWGLSLISAGLQWMGTLVILIELLVYESQKEIDTYICGHSHTTVCLFYFIFCVCFFFFHVLVLRNCEQKKTVPLRSQIGTEKKIFFL